MLIVVPPLTKSTGSVAELSWRGGRVIQQDGQDTQDFILVILSILLNFHSASSPRKNTNASPQNISSEQYRQHDLRRQQRPGGNPGATVQDDDSRGIRHNTLSAGVMPGFLSMIAARLRVAYT